MSRGIVYLVLITLGLSFSTGARAAEFGSKEEAISMVKRVQEKFRKDGADATYKAVTGKFADFHVRDLYPFVYDMNGINLAHGAKAELVGKNLLDFRDQNGKFLIREMIEVARTQGHGWVDYRWVNPVTKKIEDKTAYVEKMGNVFVGVGVYRVDQTNENTIAMISGSPNSDDTYLQVAYDLAAVLNDGDNLRILPVVGIGGPQNIRDVLSLKGIDIGLTQVSILNSFSRSNQMLQGTTDERIVYITKLFNQEVHIIAPDGVNSLEDLQGRKVNMDEVGSGTNYVMRDVFKRLNIKVEEVNVSQIDAVEQLRNGQIAATTFVVGKPARFMSTVKLGAGFHLVPLPFSTALVNDYLPASITHADYPDLVPEGQTVSTIADGVVLIAYNWPKNHDRYRRVQKFVETFFPRIAEFQKAPRHSKWSEVNLAATLPGWNRFEPAEAWLVADQSKAPDELKVRFQQFLASSQGTRMKKTTEDPAETQRLFQQFLKWNQERGSTTNSQ